MSYKSHAHGFGESYSGVVPTKRPNKGGRPLVEGVEERPLTEENTGELDLSRAQNRTSKPHRPDHVREAALNRMHFHAPLRGRNRVR